MRRPRWYRWSVVIVGQESGYRTPTISFIRFRHERQAQDWCREMNRTSAHMGLTKYEPERIKGE